MDAGFLTTVEVGQYFMTKDTAEFSQVTDAVAHLNPVLEVATCCLHGKYGVENRIMFMNKQTILTHGSEFLMA